MIRYAVIVLLMLMSFAVRSQPDTVYVMRNGTWAKQSRAEYQLTSEDNVILDILAGGLGFAKNMTDPKGFNPGDALRMVGNMPKRFKKVNRLCRRGKLKPHQCARMDKLLMTIAIEDKK